jgi:hypothetical protein
MGGAAVTSGSATDTGCKGRGRRRAGGEVGASPRAERVAVGRRSGGQRGGARVAWAVAGALHRGNESFVSGTTSHLLVAQHLQFQ